MSQANTDEVLVGQLYWHKRKRSLPPLRVVSIDFDSRTVLVYRTADFKASRSGLGGKLILPSSNMRMSIKYLLGRYRTRSNR